MDMMQKTTTAGVQRCYWKKFDREYSYVSTEDAVGGSRRMYKLAHAMNIGQAQGSWTMFKLHEYKLENHVYLQLNQGPLEHHKVDLNNVICLLII